MAVTKVSTDGIDSPALIGTNLIYNGAMNVAQRGTSATGRGGSGSGYHVQDRFRDTSEGVGTGRYTWTQTADGPVGFANCLKIDCTTADGTLAAGVLQSLITRIEAQHLQHLAYGNAAAKTLTLSFYVKCTSTGTLSVLLRQEDGGRSWHQNYTIDATDTWERKTLVFTGDASGSMADDNGTGFGIYWSLASGSNFKGGTSGSWASHGNTMYGTGDDLNVFGSTATNWFLTGVQLEVGGVATDFEHEDFGTTLRKCQRYYWQLGPAVAGAWLFGNGTSINTSSCYTHHRYPVEMRAGPTLGTSGTAGDYQIRHNATTACNAVPVFSLSGSATPNAAATQAASMTWAGNSALTAGESGALQAVNTSAILTFDAEL